MELLERKALCQLIGFLEIGDIQKGVLLHVESDAFSFQAVR